MSNKRRCATVFSALRSRRRMARSYGLPFSPLPMPRCALLSAPAGGPARVPMLPWRKLRSPPASAPRGLIVYCSSIARLRAPKRVRPPSCHATSYRSFDSPAILHAPLHCASSYLPLSPPPKISLPLRNRPHAYLGVDLFAAGQPCLSPSRYAVLNFPQHRYSDPTRNPNSGRSKPAMHAQ